MKMGGGGGPGGDQTALSSCLLCVEEGAKENGGAGKS